MIVIIEGCDFSGKSTLAQQLSNDFNVPIMRSWKPKTFHDALEWVQRASNFRMVICDRSPLISEPIYGQVIRGKPNISKRQAWHLLCTIEPIVVYCDPGPDQILRMNNDQMEGVKENAAKLYDAYNESISQLACKVIRYSWRDGDLAYPRLLHSLRGGFNRVDTLRNAGLPAFIDDFEAKEVFDFHTKFGIPMPATPQILTGEKLDFRSRFLREEFEEFVQAGLDGDVVKSFDALLDLVYVAKGTALMMGITPEQWSRGFDAVQRANMTKVRATEASQSKRNSTLDVIKPAGWQGPESTLRKILKLEHEE